jgi:hypothetical protein
MKFCEAMIKLKNGAKVTREVWKEKIYFLMDGENVKSFRPKLTVYFYNEDIMISNGWMIDNIETNYQFCDIIGYLQHGSKAKLKDWKDMYIYFDHNTNDLVCHSMETFSFTPEFNDFVAEDWVKI